MFGFLCADKINDFERFLLVFSHAYHIPFCVFPHTSLDLMLEGKRAPVYQWDGTGIVNSFSELPQYIDSSVKMNGRKFISIFGKDYVDAIYSSTTVLTQASIKKEWLMDFMLQSKFAMYSIPTYKVHTYEECLTHLKTIPKAFMKPSNGRRGIGACKIFRNDNGCFFVQDANKTVEFTDLFCREYFDEINKNGLGCGLLQPCLDFSLDDRHALDFRLLRHLGANGTWEEVATYARIGEHNVVSNVSQGGFVGDAINMLKMIADEKAKYLYNEIMMLGNDIPAFIQGKRGSDVYCLGIDVAVDKETLRPYVLEANTYPGTKFHFAALAEKRVQYYTYLISKDVHLKKSDGLLI